MDRWLIQDPESSEPTVNLHDYVPAAPVLPPPRKRKSEFFFPLRFGKREFNWILGSPFVKTPKKFPAGPPFLKVLPFASGRTVDAFLFSPMDALDSFPEIASGCSGCSGFQKFPLNCSQSA